MSRKKTNNKMGLNTAYISTVFGIVMVLLITGIVSWFVLGLNNLKVTKVESYEIDLFFDESVNPLELGLIEQEMMNKAYTSSANYRTSDEALDIILDDIGGESALDVIDGENPISPSIVMTLKQNYFSADSMKHIENELWAEYQGQLLDISYRPEIFDEFGVGLEKLIYLLLLVAIIMLFVAIGMINNTIRLALYSKRFLLKTMQLVGATPRFIRRPFLWNAFGQGLISGIISGSMVLGFIYLISNYDKNFVEMTDMTTFLTVLAGIVTFGIVITLISTYLALRKYLRLDLDKLY